MTGYIHSIQSLGTVDGPGVRAVIFASGCPFRCVYCHNPDTWEMKSGTPMEAEALVKKIRRLYPYIKDGGVTLSGGEPCLQADFFLEVVRLLHADNIHVALDTSGAVTTEAAMRLVLECDLVMLDIKMASEEDYERHVGGGMAGPMRVLDLCEKEGKHVWVRHVIVPGINDTTEDAKRLASLLRDYSSIEKIEALPFRKLCLEKYKNLGIPFPLADTPEATSEMVENWLRAYYEKKAD